MKKFYLGLVVLASFLLFSNNSYAQKQLKIGVVEVETIVKQMPEAADADKKLKDIQKNFNDTLQTMQADFYKKVENYQKQKGMMPIDQQQKEEENLKAQEQSILTFREQRYSEISDMREKYLDPIRKKVSEAIQEIAKEEGMNFVFDKNNAVMLYSEDKFDITFKVLDKIKRAEK
jgi:outer membrane protein